jgi:peptidoglycan/LPS O-acetylase OafA/YrhL
MKKQYFPILNSIRGIAALIVLVHHLILYLKGEEMDYPFPYFFDEFLEVGKYGVQIFFTLSGFLIGGNLFVERSNKTSNILNFIRNRILRIWPLYFTVLLLSLTIIPFLNEFEIFHSSARFTRVIDGNEGSYRHLAINLLLFLPNYLYYLGEYLPGFTQAWSIGVEEQFYLLVPFLFKSKRSFFFLLIMLFLIFISSKYFGFTPFLKSQLSYFISLIIGVFFGCLRYLIRPNFTKNTKGFIVVFVLLILIQVNFKLFSNNFILLSTVLGLLIFCSSYFTSKENVTAYFGKYSYGIYMYHPMIMYMAFGPLLKISSNDLFSSFWMILVFIVTLLISIVSFNYIEKPALKLKKS